MIPKTTKLRAVSKVSDMPVTAVLGPTNTGKTHYAVERMLGHGGGMIGLPLRLLAREVYDRVRLRTGDAAVALITGEEKIVPAKPQYWIATVEAMPADLDVPFLAIDEVQLAADLERGHIFTDRILHRRGKHETLFLGAATMRPILETLLPGIHFAARPRLSKLAYIGYKKLSRLPRRSAIVAFTAETVYTVAEMIRRQQGGAAIVMGALSPRTRNAQIALYQSGDVDYLVATDAIGMGLNMDVNHVAFASTRKFDGFQFRNLTPGELGQIAGRAGRHLNDGTFGLTADADVFDNETVERLENHNFDSVRMLQWRSRNLDFRSLDALRKSLGQLPNTDGLTRAQDVSDVLALEALLRDRVVSDRINSRFEVARAWEVCQVPDYRNISPAEHAHLVIRIASFLQSSAGYIPEDWFAQQLSHCDSIDGPIDALSTRISHVRTWTFIANRADWLEAPLYWQQRTREIEDRLSDALHQRLTERFINRKTSVLMRRLEQKEKLMASVEDDGAIHVEGEFVGHIRGLSFFADAATLTPEGRSLKQAATQALQSELAARAQALAMTADPELKLTRLGIILWHGNEVGRLSYGASRYRPLISVTSDILLPQNDRQKVLERLDKFVTRQLQAQLEPVIKLEEGEGLEGIARGIAYRLGESFGVLDRNLIQTEVKSLSQEDRAKLRNHGVRFGAFTVYVPALLKPAPTDFRLLLWWLEGHPSSGTPDEIPAQPSNGLTSIVANPGQPEGFYGVCGYRVCGNRAVRVDMLERLADLIRDRVFWKPRIPEEVRPAGSIEGGGFSVVPDMMSLIGCSGEDFTKILESLDYRCQIKVVKTTQPLPAQNDEEKAPAEPEPVSVAELVAEPSPDGDAKTSAVDGSETEAADSTIVEQPAKPADLELAIWWPAGTGPFRQKLERHARKPPTQGSEREAKSSPKSNPRRGKDTARGQRESPSGQTFKMKSTGKFGDKPNKPRERPFDPNSPFAVLSALKGQLSGDKS
jgi:ATP-dependent RNA helicase SUPV3L1/SUV3